MQVRQSFAFDSAGMRSRLQVMCYAALIGAYNKHLVRFANAAKSLYDANAQHVLYCCR
jgi:hypothetical protein